mgnify:CR=1 FL=1
MRFAELSPGRVIHCGPATLSERGYAAAILGRALYEGTIALPEALSLID